jgi:undecaprenyl-diphosphatase
MLRASLPDNLQQQILLHLNPCVNRRRPPPGQVKIFVYFSAGTGIIIGAHNSYERGSVHKMTGTEFAILDFIQNHMRTAFGDFIMPYISLLGNAGLIWIALTALLLLIPKCRRVGITMAVALVFDVVVCNGIIKPLVARIRPCDVNTAVQLLIARPTDYSFPSGHSAASFTAVSALYFRKNKLWIPGLVLALLIAFSRLYLYVHWPSDVLCGIILGIFLGWLGVLAADSQKAGYSKSTTRSTTPAPKKPRKSREQRPAAKHCGRTLFISVTVCMKAEYHANGSIPYFTCKG